ncbi:unnamed protein product [Angiostrongylus costaricensis]|uniref:Uncharacterized protein n=1 Tax=Angiostrongylus costaricensis TaxID=334426 RepID=A0A0R3PW48_ANGCS|nr:unnamed protein product [Angiostrongylus costaricensis]
MLCMKLHTWMGGLDELNGYQHMFALPYVSLCESDWCRLDCSQMIKQFRSTIAHGPPRILENCSMMSDQMVPSVRLEPCWAALGK